jgi:nucleoside-diphosphate-sugar epimerase
MLKHINQSPVAPKRVVILGGSGFVGKTLVNHFSKQAMDVLSVGSDQLDLDSDSSVTKLQGLLQPEDCLIILSALTPDRGRGIDTLMTNLRMIENVSSVLFEHNVAQVIYCSSDAVYPMDFPIVDEATPAAPSDLYGVMHRTREIMLQSTVKSPLCIIGEGEETRDHVYVEDLVSLIGLLVSHKSEGVVNIATGQSYSFMEIAKQVASLFDVPVEICTSARQSVITHRQFDVACIKDSFPEFSFKDFASGSKLAHVK